MKTTYCYLLFIFVFLHNNIVNVDLTYIFTVTIYSSDFPVKYLGTSEKKNRRKTSLKKYAWIFKISVASNDLTRQDTQ